MKGFLETYGVAIFTLVIIAILIAFASPIGLIIKKATNDQIKNVDKIGTEEINKTKGEGTDAYEAVDVEKSWTESHTGPYFFERMSSDQTNADYNKWKSNNKNVNSSSAVSTFTIDSPKEMEYSFDWTVSSESNYDTLTITCNETTVVNGVSGTKNGTQKVTLKSGSNTLTVTYSKDSSGADGDDCATITLPDISLCKNKQTGDVSEHIYDNGKFTKEPTCTENGEKTYTCKNCGHTKIEVVNKLGHTTTTIGEKCTRCGETILRSPEPETAVDQVYCIYYDDGEMTISQNEIEPESGRTVENYGFYDKPSDCTTEMITVRFDGAVKPKSCSEWFDRCENLIQIKNIENLYTSECTNMFCMFYNCTNLTSLDLSGWNTGKVKTMESMFEKCSSLISLNVSGWNTGNAKTMRKMFSNCTNLTNLDVSGWNTGNVTDMQSMFFNCTNLTSLDLSGWNTEKVKTMESMFWDCTNLTSLNLSGWNTRNVIDMFKMFYLCNKLQSITAPKTVQDKILDPKYNTSISSGVTWTIK